MPKITFTVDHKVQQSDGNGPEYKAGQTYDLHGSYAEKYKRLGYAVDYVDAEHPAPVSPVAPTGHSHRGSSKRR